MGYACPHCSKDIAGVTTEEAVKARLAEQKAAHQTVAEKLQADLAAATADLTRLKPLAERAETIERDLHYTRAAVPAEAIKYVEALYTLHKAEAGDKAMSRDAWLASDEAKANPLLAGVLGKGAATQATASTQAAAQAAATTTAAAQTAAATTAQPKAGPVASAGVVVTPPAAATKLSEADFRRQLDTLAERVRQAPKGEARDKARAEYDAARAQLVQQVTTPASVAT